jgi:hypothetical protein
MHGRCLELLIQAYCEGFLLKTSIEARSEKSGQSNFQIKSNTPKYGAGREERLIFAPALIKTEKTGDDTLLLCSFLE